MYAGDATGSITSINEKQITLTGLNRGIQPNVLILSATSGDTPGTVIQNGEYDAQTHKVQVMLFSPSETQEVTFDWLAVHPNAKSDKDFQFERKTIKFETFDECTYITFKQEMNAVPSIALTLYAKHKLDPFFFDYTLTWAKNVTSSGFTACVHEAVLFSGQHQAEISYIAVASTSQRYGKVTEHFGMTFNRTLNLKKCHSDDGNMLHFCEKRTFDNRYVSTPRVYVTSHITTSDQNAGEQTTWIRRATDRFVYVCTKNSEDEDNARKFDSKVSVIVAGPDLHPCKDQKKPNLDCYPGDPVPTDIKFDCWKKDNCDDQDDCDVVCSSDKGTYKSECLMQVETCQMYGNHPDGKEAVMARVSLKGRSACEPEDPVQTGRTEITDEITGVPATFCKTIPYNATRFHDYSDILIATTVSFPNKPHHNEFRSGVAVWTENVDRAAETFKACVKVTSGKYDTAVYGKPHVDWVAYQKNVHRRINRKGENPSLEGDSITVPSFRRGVRCFNLTTEVGITNQTKVILSVHHKKVQQYHMAANTWMETDNDDVSGSKHRVCVKGTEMFSSLLDDLELNWLAFHPSVAKAAADTRIQTFTDDLKYDNSNILDKDSARCRNTTSDGQQLSSQYSNEFNNRTTLVGVNALVPNDIFVTPNSRYAQFASWTETTSNEARVCFASTWPGTTILNSFVELLTFSSELE
jgi:hypothetical protein